MATNCINCGCSQISCGCKDSYLTTPPPCPTPVDCPTAQPCSEAFDAQCVFYTGDTIACNSYTIVDTNTSVADALVGIVDYICTQSQVYTVEAGAGISVSGATVGTTTSYTVTATNKLKFVKEITTNFDGASLSITQSELNACAMSPTICSATPVEFSDCSITLWWLDGTTWKLLQPYESPTEYWIASVDDVTGIIGIGITRPMTLTSYRLRAVLIF